MTNAFEINFDGLVGPTHNYAGLARGNVASSKNKANLSHPRAAALQGLEKMMTLHNFGIKQAVLPPHERPHLPTLRALGFSGSDADIIARVAKESPQLLANVSSASPMWTANAGTVSPSADTMDGRVHLTPANMVQFFHHSMNYETTGRIFSAIFSDASSFTVHDALPSSTFFGDEGAANHTRFCKTHDAPGLEFFVYGRHAFDASQPAPVKFPARQTYEASQAIARRHQVKEKRLVFAQQNPDTIDAGVFHNDVVAVGNQNVLFCHELAFLHQNETLSRLRRAFYDACGGELVVIEVSNTEVPLTDAVSSYLFNTQLVTLPNGAMMLIAPTECLQTPSVERFLDATLTQQGSIEGVHYVDIRQSMKNGGGPACLRLRVVMTEKEMINSNPAVFFDETLYQSLKCWVQKYYRDRLMPDDLADPELLKESHAALDELTHILKLGAVYPFQR